MGGNIRGTLPFCHRNGVGMIDWLGAEFALVGVAANGCDA
jgi:hypothetical protein